MQNLPKIMNKTATEIALEFNVHPNAIIYWLKKYNIPRRDTKQTRKIKYWGCKGENNPMYNVRGDKHPSWRGGITPLRQKLYNTPEDKEWFKAIYKRDGRKCKKCGNTKGLEVHHILQFGDYPLLIFSVNNGIVLCKQCHHKTKHKEARYSKKFFNLIGGFWDREAIIT